MGTSDGCGELEEGKRWSVAVVYQGSGGFGWEVRDGQLWGLTGF